MLGSIFHSNRAAILFRDVERCMWVRAGTDSGTELRESGQSGIGRGRTDFRELLNWTEFPKLRNQTETELIPGAEPVPQCSTLRNRMYSQQF